MGLILKLLLLLVFYSSCMEARRLRLRWRTIVVVIYRTNYGNKYECPGGWTNDRRYCYRLLDDQMPFDEAEESCNGLGGNLPILRNRRSQHFLTQWLEDKLEDRSGTDNYQFWMGHRCERNSCYQVTGVKISIYTFGWDYRVTILFFERQCVKFNILRQFFRRRKNNLQLDSCYESKSVFCERKACRRGRQFACADGSGCISNAKVCDQIPDCNDGSDERQNCPSVGPTCGGDINLSDEDKTIALAKYEDNSDCTWILKTKAGKKMELEFTKFKTELDYDILRVYNGIYPSSSKQIGQYSGSLSKFTVSSKANSMVLVFKSDDRFVDDGFEVKAKTVNLIDQTRYTISKKNKWIEYELDFQIRVPGKTIDYIFEVDDNMISFNFRKFSEFFISRDTIIQFYDGDEIVSTALIITINFNTDIRSIGSIFCTKNKMRMRVLIGFELTVIRNKIKFEVVKGCRTVVEDYGVVTTPGYYLSPQTYPNNLECIIEFKLSKDRVMEGHLVFDELDLEEDFDYILLSSSTKKISSKKDLEAVLKENPNALRVTSKSLKIDLFTDKGISGKGVKIRFSRDCSNSHHFGKVVEKVCGAGEVIGDRFSDKVRGSYTCELGGKRVPSKDYSCIAIGCPRPPSLRHGYYRPSGFRSVYNIKDKLFAYCYFGYILDGSKGDSITCGSNGWTGQVACKMVTCQHPNNLPTGLQIVGQKKSEYSLGESIRFNCKQGNRLQGPVYSFCMRNGKFTGFPTCEGCSSPAAILGSLRLTSRSLGVGDKVSINCYEGYEPVTGFEEATCTESGIKPSVLRCQDKNECAQNDICRNGKCVDFVGGYYCICKSGYRHYVSNRGVKDLTFCENINECKEYRNICDENCVDTDGSYECSCSKNSFLYTDETKEMANKVTSRNAYRSLRLKRDCIPYACEVPSSTDAFRVRIGGYTWSSLNNRYIPVGAYITVTATENYWIESNEFQKKITCVLDKKKNIAKWNVELPKFTLAQCSDPTSINNGYVNITENRVGSVAHIVCDPGYELEGNSAATCTNFYRGNSRLIAWFTVARCKEMKSCPLLPAPKNGNVYYKNSIGSLAAYICKNGFYLKGEMVRRCLSNGQWSGESPNCISAVCSVPQLDPEVKLETAGVSLWTIGKKAKFACRKEGYEIEKDFEELRCVVNNKFNNVTAEKMHTVLVCDGEIMEIGCPARSSLMIVHAHYGYQFRSTDKCSSSKGFHNRVCGDSKLSMDVVGRMCDHQQKCALPAFDSLFGATDQNFCGGKSRYLEVSFVCHKHTEDYRFMKSHFHSKTQVLTTCENSKFNLFTKVLNYVAVKKNETLSLEPDTAMQNTQSLDEVVEKYESDKVQIDMKFGDFESLWSSESLIPIDEEVCTKEMIDQRSGCLNMRKPQTENSPLDELMVLNLISVNQALCNGSEVQLEQVGACVKCWTYYRSQRMFRDVCHPMLKHCLMSCKNLITKEEEMEKHEELLEKMCPQKNYISEEGRHNLLLNHDLAPFEHPIIGKMREIKGYNENMSDTTSSNYSANLAVDGIGLGNRNNEFTVKLTKRTFFKNVRIALSDGVGQVVKTQIHVMQDESRENALLLPAVTTTHPRSDIMDFTWEKPIPIYGFKIMIEVSHNMDQKLHVKLHVGYEEIKETPQVKMPISCIKCNNADSQEDCKEVVQCKDSDEVCYTKWQNHHKKGARILNAGCMKKDECDKAAKRTSSECQASVSSAKKNGLCNQCCATSQCNLFAHPCPSWADGRCREQKIEFDIESDTVLVSRTNSAIKAQCANSAKNYISSAGGQAILNMWLALRATEASCSDINKPDIEVSHTGNGQDKTMLMRLKIQYKVKSTHSCDLNQLISRMTAASMSLSQSVAGISAVMCPDLKFIETNERRFFVKFACPQISYRQHPHYKCVTAQSLEEEISDSAESNLFASNNIIYSLYSVKGDTKSRIFNPTSKDFTRQGIHITSSGNFEIRAVFQPEQMPNVNELKLFFSRPAALKRLSVFVDQDENKNVTNFERVLLMNVEKESYPVIYSDLTTKNGISGIYIQMEIEETSLEKPAVFYFDLSYSNCSECVGNSSASMNETKVAPTASPEQPDMGSLILIGSAKGLPERFLFKMEMSMQTTILTKWLLLSGSTSVEVSTTSHAALIVIASDQALAESRKRIPMNWDYSYTKVTVEFETMDIARDVTISWSGRLPKCFDRQAPIYDYCRMEQYLDVTPSGFVKSNLILPTFTDNSGKAPNVTMNPLINPEDYKFDKNMDITYTATDESGNVATCIIQVKLRDVTPPTVACPPQEYIQFVPFSNETDLNKTEVSVIHPQIKVTDNGGGNVTVTYSIEESSSLPINYPVWVIATFTDSSGNKAQCSYSHVIRLSGCVPQDSRLFYPPESKIITPKNMSQCSDAFDVRTCAITCEPGYRFATVKKTSSLECSLKTGDWNTNQPFCAPYEGHYVMKFSLVITGGNVPCPLSDYRVKSLSEEVLGGMPDCYRNNVTNYKMIVKNQNMNITGDEEALLEFRLSLTYGVVDSNATLLSCVNEIESYLSNVTLELELNDLCDSITTEKIGKGTIEGLICPPGYQEVKEGDVSYCLECQAGQYLNNETQKCAECPKHSYQPLTGQTSCNSCPSGFQTRLTASISAGDCKLICRPGTYSWNGMDPCNLCSMNTYLNETGGKSCLKCPDDTYTENMASDSLEDCKEKCSAGSFSSTGLPPCSLCPRHSYQDEMGQTGCKQCAAGNATKSSGSTNKSDCESIDFCNPDPCQNGAQCIKHDLFYTCDCQLGYSGHTCEIVDDPCLTLPCANGGNCTANGTNYECSCPEGFDGKQCERQTNLCTDNTCLNNGTCQDTPTGYVCSCPELNPGRHCEQNLTACDLMPCKNNGTCMLNDTSVTGYECHCNGTGYEGPICGNEVSPCRLADQCLNGGNCSVVGESFSCSCSAAWNGDRCETDVNECSNSTLNGCLNNATCVNFDGGYSCECLPGYTGSMCETNINECNPNPCRNGGNCTDMVDDFSCDCLSGFNGSFCEVNIDDCVNCYQNGTQFCVDGINNYTCNCMTGYSGLNCSEQDMACERNPCANNSTCIDIAAGLFECNCTAGFQDKTCETNINDCEPNPCFNGECIDKIDGFMCNCSAGYEGETCANITDQCANNNCTNNSTCETIDGKATCVCPTGFTGTYCETDIDYCEGSPCLNNGTCEDLLLSYNCTCKEGFSGDMCEVTPCNQTSLCSADSTCSVNLAMEKGFECLCGDMDLEYKDNKCVEKTSDCVIQECQNGAVCTNRSKSGFLCKCDNLHTGTRCEKNKSLNFDLYFKETQTGKSKGMMKLKESSQVAVVMFIRVISEGSESVIFSLSRENSTDVIQLSQGKITVNCGGSSVTQTINLDKVKWTFISLSINDTHVTLFIQNQPVKYLTCAKFLVSTYSTYAYLGWMEESTTIKSFSGELTRFSILNGSLSEAEISTYYNFTYVEEMVLKSSLLGWFEFDSELSGSVEKKQPSALGTEVCPPGYVSPGCTPVVKTYPEVKDCPLNGITHDLKEGESSWVLNFTEPTFTDSVAFTVEKSHYPGLQLSPGTYDVIYTAMNIGNLTTSCTFTLTIAEYVPVEKEKCEHPTPPESVNVVCSVIDDGSKMCTISCKDQAKFKFSDNVPPFYKCEPTGLWNPLLNPFEFPACNEAQSPGSTPFNLEATSCDPAVLKASFIANMKKWDDSMRGKLCGGDCDKFFEKTTVSCITQTSGRRKRATTQQVTATMPDNVKTNIAGLCSDPANAAQCENSGVGCNAGYVMKNSVCVKCGDGKIPDKKTKTTCEPCDQNEYKNNETSCEPCPNDGKTAGTGATSVDDCFPECKGGEYFDDSTTPGKCVTCPSGQFSAESGQLNCLACKTGEVPTADKTNCTKCPDGEEPGAQYTCTKCVVGSYKSSSDEFCQACVSSFTTDGVGKTQASDCNVPRCPPGQYSKSGVCTDCQLGTYNVQFGVTKCTPCDKGETTAKLGAKSKSDCIKGKVNECEQKTDTCQKPGHKCVDTDTYFKCDCVAPNWVRGKDELTCECASEYSGALCDTKGAASALSQGELIGVIVGSVLGGLLLIGVIVLIFYCCTKASAGKSASYSTAGGVYTSQNEYENVAYRGDRDYNKDPEVRLSNMSENDKQHVPEIYRAVEYEVI